MANTTVLSDSKPSAISHFSLTEAQYQQLLSMLPSPKSVDPATSAVNIVVSNSCSGIFFYF